jgi:hypothetical protein
MANKVTETITELSPRIHIDEFLGTISEMSDIQKAGFKVTTNKIWMRREEWEQLMTKYRK